MLENMIRLKLDMKVKSQNTFDDILMVGMMSSELHCSPCLIITSGGYTSSGREFFKVIVP